MRREKKEEGKTMAISRAARTRHTARNWPRWSLTRLPREGEEEEKE